MTEERIVKAAATIHKHSRSPFRGIGALCACGKLCGDDAGHKLHQAEEVLAGDPGERSVSGLLDELGQYADDAMGAGYGTLSASMVAEYVELLGATIGNLKAEARREGANAAWKEAAARLRELTEGLPA